MKIALDAMGGDYGIPVNVRAALLSLDEFESLEKVYLVGNSELIKQEMKLHSHDRSRIEIVHSEQEISMDDTPSKALRQKKGSSLSICCQLHRKKEVDAVVSAGNTGAAMAFALKNLGRLPGISRPGLICTMPTMMGKPVVLLDVGANSDCKARNLLEFALMGSVFSQYVWERKSPRVGLLNIGEEPTKGNDLTVLTYKMLEKTHLNFAGNAEGRDILTGEFDVIVMDGFVGNIVLKQSESLLSLFTKLLKEAIEKKLIAKVGALLMKPAFSYLKRKLNYENYGGAVLLGLNGYCVIAHGRSTPLALKNAIKEAVYLVKKEVNPKIERELIENNPEEWLE